MPENLVTAIHRAASYSPNSVDKDAAILQSVCQSLRALGCKVVECGEDDLLPIDESQTYVTMGRSSRMLRLLENRERQGALVVNSPAGIRLCCHRSALEMLLRRSGIPLPEAASGSGYWLKRGDAPSQNPADVVYASNRQELEGRKADFLQRGITDVVVSPHVEGDLVKFYGVEGTAFFHVCYPYDDGQSKFGDEVRNGRPHRYGFNRETLHRVAERAAQTAGVVVYGGDAIVRSDGSFCIIDLNDWPSFFRCRDEAAPVIAGRVIQLMK